MMFSLSTFAKKSECMAFNAIGRHHIHKEFIVYNDMGYNLGNDYIGTLQSKSHRCASKMSNYSRVHIRSIESLSNCTDSFSILSRTKYSQSLNIIRGNEIYNSISYGNHIY